MSITGTFVNNIIIKSYMNENKLGNIVIIECNTYLFLYFLHIRISDY